MRQRDIQLLVLIVILAATAAWVVWPDNPGLHVHLGPINIDRDIAVHLGLDLRGGMQVLLEADVPSDFRVTSEAMGAAKTIVENRVNGLGVAEPVVQVAGERRILVELPGIEDPERAVATLRETGLLEFIDAGSTFLPPGTVVTTTFGETGEATTELTQEITPTEKIYPSVITGQHLKGAEVHLDEYGKPEIALEFTDEGAAIFAAHTAASIGHYLPIILDKQVISCPVIQTAIPDGRARITGQFSLEEARSIVIQLKYGALPIPLKIVQNRTIGPTLGQDSVQKSMTAGAIGLVIVLLFMAIYYRLPGVLADLALIIYAMISFALFKLIPVTLTLPGIAGFLLSVGTAVDANILIFERMKEELRAGKSLNMAVRAGFNRAWTSIRDSNLSTLLTCVILFWFGSNLGASMVKGFAVTLFLGVVVSMFTAVTVTRTFIRLVFSLAGEKLRDKKWLLGI